MRALRSEARVPFVRLALLFQRLVRAHQTLTGILRAPHAVNRIGQRVAQARVDVIIRTAREQAKRFVHVPAGTLVRRELVQNRAQDVLVLLRLRARFFRSVQIFLKTRFEDAVVVEVPRVSVPCHNVVRRIVVVADDHLAGQAAGAGAEAGACAGAGPEEPASGT